MINYRPSLPVLLFCLFLAGLSPVNAQRYVAPVFDAYGVAEQPCDQNYYTQMRSQAWLEAEREIQQNQNLIFKPDSVVKYTCYTLLSVPSVIFGSGYAFSGTDYFGSTILTNTDLGLANVLDKTLLAPVESYFLTEFLHSSLGGRGEYVGLEANPIPNPCEQMGQVWETAKCMNFVHNQDFAATDSFYPIESMTHSGVSIEGYDIKQEIRPFPSACTNGQELWGSGGTATSWADEIKYANNNAGEKLYEYEDPVNIFFNETNFRIEPGNCSVVGIKTGISIIHANENPRPDGVCPNPGCSYTLAGTCE